MPRAAKKPSSPPKNPKSNVTHLKKVALFATEGEAHAFVADLQSLSRRGDFISNWKLNTLMNQHGGSPLTSSAGRRELRVYQYQPTVYQEDRDYLFQRDPTVEMLCKDPAAFAWEELPEALNPVLDDYFTLLTDLGLPEAMALARMVARRDGGAFVHLATAGMDRALTDPLTPRDELLGFQVIPARNIGDDPLTTVRAPASSTDPLLRQHGFASLGLYANDEERTSNNLIPVHGHRLMAVAQRNEARWWRGPSLIDARFDVAWNLRDVEYMQRQGQLAGNPIGVFVDVENEYESNPESDAALDSEMGQYRGEGREYFSRVEGAELKRIGPMDLDKPTDVIGLLAARFSHGTEYTVNHVIPTSRGSEQITNQDLLHFARGVRLLRAMERQLLLHLVNVGKQVGLLPRRLRLPAARDLYWPSVLEVTPQDEARMVRGMSMAMQTAAKSGRTLATRFDRHFPRVETAFDPDFILPSVSAKVSDEMELEEDKLEVEREKNEKQAERDLLPEPDESDPDEE